MASGTIWRVLIHSTSMPTSGVYWADRPSIATLTFATVAGGATVATGGTALASTEVSGAGPATNAFDGDPSTIWSGSIPTPPTDTWIQYTFPSAVAIAEVRIQARPDAPYAASQGPGTWDLQVSSDGGATFRTVQSYTSGPWTAGQTQTFAVAATAKTSSTVNRYWRLYVNTNDENGPPVFSHLGMYAGQTTPNLATVPAQASASTEYNAGSNAGMALSAGWSASAPPIQWWQYDLGAGQSVSVNQFSVMAVSGLSRRAPRSYTIRSSADGVTFQDEWSGTFPAWTDGQVQSTINPAYVPAAAPTTVSSTTWRILIHATAVPDSPNASGGANYPSLSELIFAGTVGGPSLASGGTAQASSETSGSSAASAFDGNVNTLWGSTTACPIDAWLQYTFSSPVSVAEVRIAARNDGVGQYQAPGRWDLQYLNAIGSYTTVQSYASPTWVAGQFQTFAVTPVGTAYSIYRLLCHTTNPSNPRAVCIQELIFANAAGGATICTGGTASASSIDSAPYAAASAFDGTSSFWASSVAPPPDQWLQYAFPAPVAPVEFRIVGRPDGYATITGPTVFDLLGSNDGVQYTVIKSYVSGTWDGTPNQSQTFAIPTYVSAPAPGAYAIWRALIHTNAGQPVNTSMQEFILASTAGGPSICTGGIASALSELNSSYVAANAFDGTSSFWVSQQAIPPNQWIQYKFPHPVAPVEVRIISRPDGYGQRESALSWDLMGSNDGTNFTLVQSYNSQPWTTSSQVQAFAIPVPGPPGSTKLNVSQFRGEVVASSASARISSSQVRADVIASSASANTNSSQVRADVVASSASANTNFSQVRLQIVVSTKGPIGALTTRRIQMMLL